MGYKNRKMLLTAHAPAPGAGTGTSLVTTTQSCQLAASNLVTYEETHQCSQQAAAQHESNQEIGAGEGQQL